MNEKKQPHAPYGSNKHLRWGLLYRQDVVETHTSACIKHINNQSQHWNHLPAVVHFITAVWVYLWCCGAAAAELVGMQQRVGESQQPDEGW